MKSLKNVAKGIALSAVAFFSVALFSNNVIGQTCGIVNPGDITVEVVGNPAGPVDVSVDYVPSGSSTGTTYVCNGMNAHDVIGIPAGATIYSIHVDAGVAFTWRHKHQ